MFVRKVYGFSWFLEKNAEIRKFWALLVGLRRSEGSATPWHGRDEDFSILRFAAAKLKLLFTACKYCVFVSFCFSVVSKTGLWN